MRPNAERADPIFFPIFRIIVHQIHGHSCSINMLSIPPKEYDLIFPDFTLVSASAGSGKTHALTYRYLQFILSKHISENNLRNILAITFTNNAAREMKQRILEELKKASLGDLEVLTRLSAAISEDKEEVRRRANAMVDGLLHHYSEFQVQTIDSFLSRVFRASALEFGFSPNVEILIDSTGILRQAFDQFAQELTAEPSKRAILDDFVGILLANLPADSRYLWNPFSKLSEEVRGLYNKLAQQTRDIAPASDLLEHKLELRTSILATFVELRKQVLQSGFEIQKNFEALFEPAERKDVEDLLRRKSLYNLPIKKSGLTKSELDRWTPHFEPLQSKLKKLADEYVLVSAHTYYHAYAEALRYFRGVIEHIMKEEGRVTIGDVNRHLAATIDKEVVPEIYYYLGERISHYLIDEFQDTSPLQWEVFRPLAEESLAKGGSLFIVGDTKQSIYTFRGADWQIMRRLMSGEDGFPSAPVRIRELDTNFRSFERIVNFNKEVFQTIVPSVVTNGAERLSGLSDYVQHVRPEFKGKGYAEVFFIEEDPERIRRQEKILEILGDCLARSYSYSDITILTPKNSDVVDVSGWLNRRAIPFISHSNLDIRGRKVTGELIAILRFLDSPLDDLSLMTFVLGDIFGAQLKRTSSSTTNEQLQEFLFKARRGTTRSGSLYGVFRERFPDLWSEYFEELFNRVGYLPLYDLVSELYKSFNLFDLLPNEEGSLAKFLEVIKDFEEGGQNSLKDFLVFAEEENEDSDWNIPVPQKTDAVSVMTTHKAKGLGNRVVIVLLEDSLPRPDNLFIQEEEDGLHLLRINKDSAEVDAGLQRMYAERKVRRTVDDLNKLYVAFTRAKEELYVISVKSKRGDEPSKFLPVTGYEPGEKPEAMKQPPSVERTVHAEHLSARAALQPVTAGSIGLYERKRGEFIHAILARLEFLGEDVDERIQRVAKEIQDEMREHLESRVVERLLIGFLEKSEARQFFLPRNGRKILNEQEFARADGRLFRMDRLLVDLDAVTVIDFKTGNENAEYSEQVQGYMNILSDVYPGRSIRGFLAYVDRTIVREVISMSV
jgi:ATP-dependent helicase/nuclease subunit A